MYNLVCPYVCRVPHNVWNVRQASIFQEQSSYMTWSVRNSGKISFRGIYLLQEWSDLYKNFREYSFDYYLPDEKLDFAFQGQN